MRVWTALGAGLLACAASHLPAQSDSGVVRGVVSDSSGAPLQGAIVRTYGRELRAISRTDGSFALALPPATDARILVNLIGYRAASHVVSVRAGETTRVSFRLARAPLGSPPLRVPRLAGADSAPESAEKIDRIARILRLPRLRPSPSRREETELRLWVGFGIGIPMQLLRLRTFRGRTTGELYHWIHIDLPDPKEPTGWRSFVDSIPAWLQREHECPSIAVDTARSNGAGRTYEWLVVGCRVRPRVEPDWPAVLRELERHQIWTLPDGSEAPPTNVVTVDGAGVIVETWDGRRYRSYRHGNPDGKAWPAGAHAEAILMKVISLVQH